MKDYNILLESHKGRTDRDKDVCGGDPAPSKTHSDDASPLKRISASGKRAGSAMQEESRSSE